MDCEPYQDKDQQQEAYRKAYGSRDEECSVAVKVVPGRLNGITEEKAGIIDPDQKAAVLIIGGGT